MDKYIIGGVPSSPARPAVSDAQSPGGWRMTASLSL